LRGLYDNVKNLVLDVRGLPLDGGGVWSERSVDLSYIELAHQRLCGNRLRSTGLTGLTRQKRQIFVDLAAGDARRVGRAGPPIRYRDGETCSPDHDRSTVVAHGDLAEKVDDARSVLAMRDGRRPAANSDRCDRCIDGRGALVTDAAADETQRALGESRRHLADAGGRVIYEIVDHEVAVWSDVQCGLIHKQQLNRPDIGCLDPLLVHDPGANP
jgi:hypothetical protein